MTHAKDQMLSIEKVHGARLELARLSTVEPKALRRDRREATSRLLPGDPTGGLQAQRVPPICPPPTETALAIARSGSIPRTNVALDAVESIALRETSSPPPSREVHR